MLYRERSLVSSEKSTLCNTQMALAQASNFGHRSEILKPAAWPEHLRVLPMLVAKPLAPALVAAAL
jgi:hypothetical protein